jgi:uncharacterized protein YjgD (DUF1641 family)
MERAVRTNGARPADAMARIEARLARIEAMLSRVEQAAEPLPGMVAAAGDAIDEIATTYGEPDARLQQATALVERLTRPETLEMLQQALDVAESMPGMMAAAVDAVDELAAQAAARGVDLETLMHQLVDTAQGMTRLATSPEVQQLLESDMMSKGALTALSSAARALAVAREDDGPTKVGIFGAMGAMRDPDVQKAVAFGLRFARGFGQNCDALNANRKLTAG